MPAADRRAVLGPRQRAERVRSIHSIGPCEGREEAVRMRSNVEDLPIAHVFGKRRESAGTRDGARIAGRPDLP